MVLRFLQTVFEDESRSIKFETLLSKDNDFQVRILRTSKSLKINIVRNYDVKSFLAAGQNSKH
jgi:hypothetical protein